MTKITFPRRALLGGLLAALAALVPTMAEARGSKGCSSRGGPGGKRKNGKCPSWRK